MIIKINQIIIIIIIIIIQFLNNIMGTEREIKKNSIKGLKNFRGFNKYFVSLARFYEIYYEQLK